MFLEKQLFSAYHYIQPANHIVDLDDPVDRLGALEQQDDITMQWSIVFQRPQFHYDIHLESTAEKERGKKEMDGALCVWPTN